MQTVIRTLLPSALISFLLILPFTIMEIVNRRAFNEGFPFMVFSIMWLDTFAIGLILLPLVRGRRTGRHDLAVPVSTQGNTLLTNSRSTAIISVVLVLSVVMIN